jgi:hypothetical protein
MEFPQGEPERAPFSFAGNRFAMFETEKGRMNSTEPAVRVVTVSASSQVKAEHRGQVVVSGSYGGEYNAYHAGKWGIRGVILNDAGVGKDNAGIRGLPYLDQIGLAAATADARTCHIADGDHMLEHGTISHVNRSAAALGCKPGETVRACAERMRSAKVAEGSLPPIAGGKRFTIRDNPGEPRVICLDAAPMLQPEDAGAIAITGSHAALFRGKPDGVISVDLRAVFFNDAGVGMDGAGISRLADLDKRGMVAGAASADSAPIGDSRAIYGQGILSHVNATAAKRGARPGMAVKEFVDLLIAAAKQQGRV